MPRIVDRGYLVDLLNQSYRDQEGNCFFCFTKNCIYSKKSVIVDDKLRKKIINSSNSSVVLWKVTNYKNDPSILTIIPVH